MSRVSKTLRVLVTLALVAAALLGGAALWQYYLYSPWTRDGRVRTEVVGIAPEVAGRIASLPIVDNQFVHKGDLLFTIDPESYRLNVAQAEAVVENRVQDQKLRESQSSRRAKLDNLSVSAEEKEQYAINAAISGAALRQAQVAADIARLDLARTEVRSPVNGYVTNLLLRIGDFATTGKVVVTLIDADAFWASFVSSK
jgi:RND family efflux transporter MFP subunit